MTAGAISGPMIDEAMPPACIAEARAAVASKRGAWIDRAVRAMQAHNRGIENGGRCQHCGSQRGILWEPPPLPAGWVARFLAERFPA
ncbi:MAG: hypothetical protein V4510_09715 [bacterium]